MRREWNIRDSESLLDLEEGLSLSEAVERKELLEARDNKQHGLFNVGLYEIYRKNE